MTPFQHGLPGLLQQSDLTDIPFNLTRQDVSREPSLLFPQASTIVPGPPSTESIECTYHSPITDAERAVTQQSQHPDQHPVSRLALPRRHLGRFHYGAYHENRPTELCHSTSTSSISLISTASSDRFLFCMIAPSAVEAWWLQAYIALLPIVGVSRNVMCS
jgi:hypothetical protein